MENKNLEREINKEINEETKAIKEATWLLPASILVAAVLIAGSVIYSTGVKNSQPVAQQQVIKNQSAEVNVDKNDPILGNSGAPITVVEFGDFQCPYCVKFYHEIEAPLKKNYIDTGKIKFVFKPVAIVDSIVGKGTESKDSVNAVECAGEQGKFWEFHDALYNAEYGEFLQVLAGKLASSEGSGNLNVNLFKKISSNLGMNTNDFLSCYNSGKHAADYQIYEREAAAAMPQFGTPAVFLNGQKVELSMNSQRKFDFDSFAAILDAALKK